MWVNLRPPAPPQYSGPVSDSSPSTRQTPHNLSTPATAVCAGHAYRHETKNPPDPAARQSKVSYADKTDCQDAGHISFELNPSQKPHWRRRRHFPRRREDFPASFARGWAPWSDHKRSACIDRLRTTPAWDGAD